MLEKEIEAKVCAYAEEKGFVHYKFTSPAHFGVPDRIFFGDMGTVFLIEFKREGGKSTPTQDREALRLSRLNHRVYLVDTVEKGIDIIDGEAEMLGMKQQAFAAITAMKSPDEVMH
jgi:hypothetical protein